MPWGDGTGPRGEGPMTGRGMGYCVGYGTPGYANPRFGRWPGRGRGFGGGFGRGGFGRGRGFRNWARATGLPGWYRARVGMPAFGRAGRWVPVQRTPIQQAQFVQPQLTKDQEIQFLEEDIKYLEEERRLLDKDLESIKKRLNELKKKE